MKKLILAVMLTAFAVAVQAGNGTCCSESGSCSKTKTSTVTKSECPFAKQQSQARAQKTTKVVVSKVLLSPKAASQAG
jgi:hypothetical protein